MDMFLSLSFLDWKESLSYSAIKIKVLMMTLTAINGGLFHSLQNLSSTWHSADLKTFSIFYLQYM